MNTEIPAEEPANLDLSAKGIWQPLPAETSHSYVAFTEYLKLGLDGTLQQVADATGKSLTAVYALSARHDWMDRAAAYRQNVSQTYLASVERQRARQTELCQMRDQLLRQELWEDHQSLRAICRENLQLLRTDPAKATIAPYALKGLFELVFKFGKAATAPTGFTSEGPAPASSRVRCCHRSNLRRQPQSGTTPGPH
jgi:hypothetical protein